MKTNTFNYSLLAVGVAAVMGLSTGANAATPTGGNGTGSFDVKNKATATYTVAGNTTVQNAASNEVTVMVNETSSFSLVASPSNTDTNTDFAINPQANSTVNFVHKLANTGNVNDTYTINLANVTGDDFDYGLGGTPISYQIKSANGTNVGGLQSIANGGTISLAPTQTADITVVGTATTERLINRPLAKVIGYSRS